MFINPHPIKSHKKEESIARKKDQNFIAFCDELWVCVEEHRLFPDKHTN